MHWPPLSRHPQQRPEKPQTGQTTQEHLNLIIPLYFYQVTLRYIARKQQAAYAECHILLTGIIMMPHYDINK
jgi:hypothetical protein